MALTERQRKILEFIKGFMEERGYSPSIREIVKGCGLSSTSVAEYNLRVLEREGYIEREREISRGIKIGGVRRIPLVGVIAAGEPLPLPPPGGWASDALEYIEVPTEFFGKGNIYALRVKGKSMVDALIDDGDIVIVEARNFAEDGEMVAVWLRDRNEVTLKRIYREGEWVKLVPESSEASPIYVEPRHVEIQGRVIGVIRKIS